MGKERGGGTLFGGLLGASGRRISAFEQVSVHGEGERAPMSSARLRAMESPWPLPSVLREASPGQSAPSARRR